MVTELKAQQQDEIAFLDNCIKELNTNKRGTAASKSKRKLGDKNLCLGAVLKTLAKKTESTKAAIVEARARSDHPS